MAQAVMTGDTGQTVGTQKQNGAVFEAKIGPVGDRARVELTFVCEKAPGGFRLLHVGNFWAYIASLHKGLVLQCSRF